MLPTLKQHYPWLAEVSAVPLQQALRHLDRGCVNVFAGRADDPTFKKKRHDQAAPYACNAFRWDGKALTLAQMDAPLDMRFHRLLPQGCKPRSVTVTKASTTRYFISIVVAEDIKPLPITSQMVGLDLGIKSMVVLSTAESVGNPRYFAAYEKQVAKAQARRRGPRHGSRLPKCMRRLLIAAIRPARHALPVATS